MAFDVNNVDLDKLGELTEEGGIAALEDLVNGKEVKATEPEKTEPEKTEPEKAEDDKTPAEPEKKEPEKTETEEQDHGTAVSTKDGKGTIPYSVLKGARERANQLDQQNRDLQKQVDEMKTKLESGKTVDVSAASEEVDAQVAEMQRQIDTIKDDFPELAALMTGQMQLLQNTQKQLATLQAREDAEKQDEEAQAQAQIEETIQDAIDARPTLAAWQAKDGTEWEACVEMDVMLRKKPEWANKTFAERFEKVEALVRVMHPEFEATDPVKTEDKAPDTKLTPDTTSTDVNAQATPSGKRQAPINSLSDLPGGVPPAGSKTEQAEEMSSAALGNKFLNMSNDQINEYLATLGMN